MAARLKALLAAIGEVSGPGFRVWGEWFGERTPKGFEGFRDVCGLGVQ